MPTLTLVLGGARSGKSRYAESLFPEGGRYIATAQAFDDEMRDRIAAHRRAREGAGWTTVEAPLALAAALAAAPELPVLVDCLTLWLTNLMLADRDPVAATEEIESAIAGRSAATVLVSNEVGLGIVPDNALARRFRDEAGRLHQRLAAAGGRGVLSGSGAADAGEMTMSESDEEARHRAKMAKRKAVQDAEVASKLVIEKGLLIVHTGSGKGKSTAAFGLMVRMIGYGRPVGVVQFIKGAWSTGERAVLERIGGDLVRWHTMGEGFTWETQDRARDVAACRRAWERTLELLQAPGLALLVLDELNIALRYDYLSIAEVLAGLAGRPEGLHVVVTGRNAPPALIEAADLVTEMTLIKHHFAAGVKAQEGIEY